MADGVGEILSSGTWALGQETGAPLISPVNVSAAARSPTLFLPSSKKAGPERHHLLHSLQPSPAPLCLWLLWLFPGSVCLG